MMTETKAGQLDPSWMNIVGKEFDKPYMFQLRQFLLEEKKAGKTVYPPGRLIFNALNATPFEKVRVVIIGQDPYHGPNQAHGLCFSVRDGIDIPPSLVNIYKEISAEYGCPMPRSGDLTRWAEQGVLLLNATLTVVAGLAGSHQNKGWEEFTDSIIRAINEQLSGVVFLLWGSYAQKKGAFIDRNKHLVLTAPHPSPLSAHRGFIGCGHFKQTNEYLKRKGIKEITWF